MKIASPGLGPEDHPPEAGNETLPQDAINAVC
jgi:hypothetical protein